MEIFFDTVAFIHEYESEIYTHYIINETTLYIDIVEIEISKNALYAIYVSVTYDISQPQLIIHSNFVIYVQNVIVCNKYIVYRMYDKQKIYKHDNIQYTSYINDINYGYIAYNRYNGICHTIVIYHYEGEEAQNFIEIHLDQYENILNYKCEVESMTFAEFIELVLNIDFDYPESIKNYDFVNGSIIDKCG
jgi:hypothetical protein